MTHLDGEGTACLTAETKCGTAAAGTGAAICTRSVVPFAIEAAPSFAAELEAAMPPETSLLPCVLLKASGSSTPDEVAAWFWGALEAAAAAGAKPVPLDGGWSAP